MTKGGTLVCENYAQSYQLRVDEHFNVSSGQHPHPQQPARRASLLFREETSQSGAIWCHGKVYLAVHCISLHILLPQRNLRTVAHLLLTVLKLPSNDHGDVSNATVEQQGYLDTVSLEIQEVETQARRGTKSSYNSPLPLTSDFFSLVCCCCGSVISTFGGHRNLVEP